MRCLNALTHMLELLLLIETCFTSIEAVSSVTDATAGPILHGADSSIGAESHTGAVHHPIRSSITTGSVQSDFKSGF